ncbi:MAG: ASCH domain-containing protein [Chloroflexales bacterium]|nr:ASCH domain-containing protein [Chloroflexales bacterium]
MNPDAIAQFWQAYLAILPPDAPHRQVRYIAESFGDNPALADELGALIRQGRKTATCSALWEWEAEGTPIPQPGLITIVLDGPGQPLCIIETTEVTVRAYNEVAAAFAAAEGEGDRSLASWREAHWRYFSRVLPRIGRAPTEDMPLVCEHFRLLYPLVSAASAQGGADAD